MTEWKVFFIGDSISIQYGPWLETFLTPSVSYARKAGVNDALRDLDVPQGANGGDSRMVLEYLSASKNHQEIGDVDVLAINCGLHDIKTDPESRTRQVGPDEYRSNLERIVEIGKPLCRWLVWVSTTPCMDAIHNARSTAFHRYREDVLTYNRIADAVMRVHDIPIIDLFGLTEKLESERGDAVYKDHVHFAPEIQHLQGAYIAGWINAHRQANQKL
ncbi:MAG: SGNH/GDSL hydrolase family protein [Spirochaetaceae bacterium]